MSDRMNDRPTGWLDRPGAVTATAALGLGCEGLAAWAVLVAPRALAVAPVLGAIGLHAAAVVAAVRISVWACGRLGLPVGRSRPLFAVAAATVPVLGSLALVGLLWRMAGHAPAVAPAWVVVSPPRLEAWADEEDDDPAPAVEPDARPSPGGRDGAIEIEARVRFATDPERRVQAVLGTRSLAVPQATRLLRLGLRDPVDDVRLLAHALLEARQREADASLAELEGALADAGEAERPRVELLLAELYLDLSGSGLMTGELEAVALGRARVLLERRRAGTEDPASESRDTRARRCLLLGKVLLGQRQPGPAQAMLEESRRLGMPDLVLAPGLAEAAFALGHPGSNGRWV
jgi:hypothetical protein